MAQPKKRTSKQKRKQRHANWKVKINLPIICSNCGAFQLPHTACPSCGYYKGKKVVTTKGEKKELQKARRKEES
jgi:large subunit ribosomal protein L32